jgi:hypothetical protein
MNKCRLEQKSKGKYSILELFLTLVVIEQRQLIPIKDSMGIIMKPITRLMYLDPESWDIVNRGAVTEIK